MEIEECKRRTCKILYNQNRIHHRTELVKGLSKLVEKESIEAVHTMNKPKEWFISFKTENKAIEFSTMTISIEGKEYKPKLYNNQERDITIHWAPDFLPNELIAEHFNKTHTVIAINKDKDRYGFYTGNRKITLESAEINTIPHIDSIANHPILITTPGRPPLCLKCQNIGHIRQNCTTPFCRHCQIFGHSTENCIPSYATTLRSNNVNRTPPEPTPAQSGTNRSGTTKPTTTRPTTQVNTENKKTKKTKQTRKDNTTTDTEDEKWQVARYKGKRMIKKLKPNSHTEEDTNTDSDNTDISPQYTSTHMDTDEENELEERIKRDIQEDMN